MTEARVEISEWFVRAAVAGANEIGIVAFVCERMNA
jgi:hypothetical protein